MDNAEVYLLLLRPTRVPVAGEAVAEFFQGQVELHGWSWSFHNEQEKKHAEDEAKKYGDAQTKWETRVTNDTQRKLLRMNDEFERLDVKRELGEIGSKKMTDAERQAQTDALTSKLSGWNDARNKKLAEYEKEVRHTLKQYENVQEKMQAEADQARDDLRAAMRSKLEDEAETAKGNKNFEFSFSKRVDVSTTQLLNSMKAGDVFPTGVLTIHQRSANAGLSLVINVQRVRLLDYSLKVEVSETMTDMREEWTAEFGALAYVYKNRRQIASASGAGQAVAQAASQGTVRAFAMKNIGSPI